MIVKTLFELATKPPKEWLRLKFKVTRRDREQTAAGATRSALYGAAFQIQAANMRAAGNHVIQSSGATTCKALQRQIWDIQPGGIHHWRVQPLNIHDEIMTPTLPQYVPAVTRIVEDFMVELKKKVPLAEIDWGVIKTWADK